jgi:hypothetical protein
VKAEQQRIGDSVDRPKPVLRACETEYTQIAGNLDQAVELVAPCHEGYLIAKNASDDGSASSSSTSSTWCRTASSVPRWPSHLRSS